MQRLFQIVFLVSFLNVFSQEVPNFEEVDSLYREDQFYLNMTYNILKDKPSPVSQNSFSGGYSFGFLRDFPINKKRTYAIAPGLGISYNNYKYNLLVAESNGVVNYTTLASTDLFDKNKLALYTVDVPVEFRWRTSTFESHKFWRIYTGFKFSYVFFSKSKFVGIDGNFKVINNPDINKFQYGAYLSAGYNSWNIYVYYGLQDIFNKPTLNGELIHLNTLNIGLMFYIL